MPGHAKHIELEALQRRRTHYGIRESDGGNACVESADNDTAYDSLLQAIPDGNDKQICEKTASGFI